MPSSIGHGPISLRIEQRQVDTNKKIEEIERKGADGTIVRYQRNVAEGLLHRIGRFFTDLATGEEKARGILCDRTPNNVPTHIMVMGHKVTTQRAAGSGLRAEIEFPSAESPNSAPANKHNPSRLKKDMQLQLDMKGKKDGMAAMKTFLKYATGEAAIPAQIKGNSQRREMDSVIRQLKQLSETLSEMEQENGLHAADAGWAKKELTNLLNSAKNIRQADAADHDPVKRLNMSASLWQSIEEFAALQSTIKLPSPTASAEGKNTTAVMQGPPPPGDLPPPLPTVASTPALPIVPDTITQAQSSTQTIASAPKDLKGQARAEAPPSSQPPAAPQWSAQLPADTATATVDSPASSDRIPTPPPFPPSLAPEPPAPPPLPESPTSSASAPPAPPPPAPAIAASGIQGNERNPPSGSSLMDQIKEGRTLRKVGEDDKKKPAPPPENPNDLGAILAKAMQNRRSDIDSDAGTEGNSDEWE